MQSIENLKKEEPPKLSEENQLEKNAKNKSNDTAAGLIVTIMFCLFCYWLWSWAFGDEHMYKQKAKLQSEISTMVKNGADLDSLKHHLTTAFDQEWGLLYRWGNDKSEHYKNDTSLLTILKDIKNQAYLNESAETSVLTDISKLSDEYEQRNPFDGLEPNQKDLFENIRIKLNDNYHTVSNDINKLSDELFQKNRLVTQYLSDSQSSLYISIASLAFGVVFPHPRHVVQ